MCIVFQRILTFEFADEAISYCPSWVKQVSSNESLAPGSLCPWPAGATADLSPFRLFQISFLSQVDLDVHALNVPPSRCIIGYR